MRVEVIEGVKVIFRIEKHGSSAEMVIDGRKHRNAITGSRLESLRQWVIETLNARQIGTD